MFKHATGCIHPEEGVIDTCLCAVQMAVFYFFSPRVTRSVMYGTAARNRLDIYRPPSDQQPPANGFPVVIYLTGQFPGIISQILLLGL